MNDVDGHYECHDCGQHYPWTTLEFRCQCGGLFAWSRGESDVHDSDSLEAGDSLGYFRWLPRFLWKALEEISLGESWTPLERWEKEQTTVAVKMEQHLPTNSFKDRGAVVLAALAKVIDAQRIVQDSSGNAGYATAAYAARARIPCEIFVPDHTHQRIVRLIESTGARLVKVAGTREDTAMAAYAAAEDANTFYASHVFNPLFVEGTRTWLLETYSQLGQLPSQIIVPVGNGTLLLGAYRAMQDLIAVGRCDNFQPIIAAQASGCAPIATAFENGCEFVTAVENLGTVAKGIAIADPKRGSQILAAVRRTGGTVVSISEDETLRMLQWLKQQGYQVAAATGVTFAAMKNLRHTLAGTSVIPICGLAR